MAEIIPLGPDLVRTSVGKTEMTDSLNLPSLADFFERRTERSGNPPILLTIAGSDPSAGAGIQADLKTFSALGVYGLTVITAITGQNSRGVMSIHPLPSKVVRDQLQSVLDDFDVTAIKIGMIASRETRVMLEHELRDVTCPIILDPISQSTSGMSFTGEERLIPFLGSLINRAYLITPNIPEVEELTGIQVDSTEAMQLAGEMLLMMGAQNVLIKGGHDRHSDLSDSTDVLVTPEETFLFRSPRIESTNLHGTGCTLSSAIASFIAHGEGLPYAVRLAKEYVSHAIESAQYQTIGNGYGPLDHFFNTKNPAWSDVAHRSWREEPLRATQQV